MAYMEGIRHCAHTQRRSYTPEQAIRYAEKTCAGYGFSTSAIGDKIFISTNIGSWMITISNDGKVDRLDHGSKCVNGAKMAAQYHRQEWADRSLPNTLYYIKRHDEAALKPKKTRLDAIFEAISR